ncbi:MAG: oxidoreductase [Myxococcales bacterium]|nr:oxidoreductase [Myxococcales bacterium]
MNALVTGASSGIGRGLALALGKRGAHVVVAARRKERLDSLVGEIAAAGGRGEALVLDASDGDATYEAVRAVDARLPLDLVIANAGIGGITPGKKLVWERVRDILQTNLVGAAATISAAMPGMVARGDGRIVGIASVAGFVALPRFAAYSASKAGLITLLESLRIDLHGSGVSVTTVCPGYVDTDLLTPGKKHPFLVALDDAVATILRAVDKREAMCTFPAQIVVPLKAAQLLPRPLYEFVATRSSSKVKY